MTAATGGVRFGDPERARFIRALFVSLLLHGLLFPLKMGPASGVRTPSLPNGGMIEAILRRVPTTGTAPPQSLESSPPPTRTAVVPIAIKPPTTEEAISKPTVATVATAAAVSSTMTSDAPNQRNEGHESVTGAAAKGSESTAIPMLPPLPTNVREVPGHPSLLVPLYFSYPPNIRILSGRVRVRILLDDKGQVEEVRSVASNPPGFFDHTAIQVLRSGRFTPGFVGPMKVRSYLFMDVTFGPGSQGQQIWYVGSAFAPPAQPR